MKIKKADIERILSIIVLYDGPKEVAGLLTEEIPLSLKRRLQKIRTELLNHHNDLVLQRAEVSEKFKAEDQKEQLELEMKILHDEPLEVNQDPVSLAMIEAIKTKANYDFEIIELIAS